MLTAERLVADDVEFWPLGTVIQKVGLSRSEIYRQVLAGTFPGSRTYRNNPTRKFWVSTDVRHWQAEQLEAPSAPQLDDDEAALIG